MYDAVCDAWMTSTHVNFVQYIHVWNVNHPATILDIFFPGWVFLAYLQSVNWLRDCVVILEQAEFWSHLCASISVRLRHKDVLVAQSAWGTEDCGCETKSCVTRFPVAVEIEWHSFSCDSENWLHLNFDCKLHPDATRFQQALDTHCHCMPKPNK